MKKLIPFLCVFMYFMSPYRLAGHEMPEVLGLFAMILGIIVGYRLHFEKSCIVFLLYMWIVPPIASVVCGIPGNYLYATIPVALILSLLYLSILVPNVNKKYVLKFYKVLVYIAIGFFLLQEFAHITTGFRPTLYMPFFEMYYEGSDVASFALSRAEMDRSSSFFLEPSHFVQYIIPYYCIILSNFIIEKKGVREVLFMTFVIIWLRAGTGYVSLFVIGNFFLLKNGVMKLYQKVAIVMVIVATFFVITLFFVNNEFIASILGRTSEFSMEVEAHGSQSGFIRIWRGYFIYATMEVISQLLGVGIVGMEYVSNAVYIPGCRYEGTYMNGIQALLVSGGLVGLLLFMNYIFRLYKKVNLAGQCILVAMITIFFMEHMLYTPKMFLYILLASCFVNSYRTQNVKCL